jgi:hypothetical protein
MALQLAPAGSENGSVYGGSQRGRPTSSYHGNGGQGPGGGQLSMRVRSKSVAEPRQYTKEGKPILHYGTYLPFAYSDWRVVLILY